MSVIYSVLRGLGASSLIVSFVVLAACQGQVKAQAPSSTATPRAEPRPNASSEPAPQGGLDLAAEVIPVPQASPTPVPNPLAEVEKKLLREAERAFREKNYTTPTYNNAYDKFQSVLLLNPQNDQARAGLQAILLRYAGLTRSAMAKGRLSSAERYLQQAEQFYPANSLLIDLKKQIVRERQRIAATQPLVPQEPPDLNAEEIPLSPAHLNVQSAEVIELLAGVAQRLRQSDESVMIFARNDREGRWIYKQLKQSAEGYRVRGDIRIGRKPKLQILPPL